MRGCQITWLHGPAGVGKSAVIQTLAESEASLSPSVLGATLFFSRPHKRDNPQRVVTTIAYQLAVKYPAYYTYVAEQLRRDPLLVTKSLVEQFKCFISRPFSERDILQGTRGTILVALDGLDECNDESLQCEIITLISSFCLEHPATPLIWIITSRPEPGICSTFSHCYAPYIEIDMPIDSDFARRDVELYLRDTFIKIKGVFSTSFSPAQEWPTETDFIRILRYSSGLFAFAHTIACFVGDLRYANPVAQLQKVLNVLKHLSSPTVGDSPFAVLDIHYTLILSSILPEVLPVTRKLLLVKNMSWSLIKACNMLSISQADAYAALRKLHSVLRIPQPETTFFRQIEVFHKSFDDYLKSPSRSGEFWLDPSEVDGTILAASVRILLEAQDTYKFVVRPSNIKLSWPGGGMEAYRIPLFERSIWAVLKAPYDKSNSFGNLRHFFEDIDYAGLEVILPRAFQEDIIHRFFASPLIPYFEKWGLLATFPVQDLDLNAIGPGDPAYIFSTSGGAAILDMDMDSVNPSDFTDSCSTRDGVWLKCRLHEYVTCCHHCKIFDVSAGVKKLKDYSWYGKRFFLQDGSRWRARVHEDLGSLPPTHLVATLGKGNKKLLLVDFGGSNGHQKEGVYTLPYRPS